MKLCAVLLISAFVITATAPSDAQGTFFLTKSTPDDQDGDGLPDQWERDRESWGLSDEQANLIVVIGRQPNLNVTRQKIEAAKRRASAIFAAVPLQTKFGKQGIDVIFRNGQPISRPQDASVAPNYEKLRTIVIPEELIGFAHAVYLTEGSGGKARGIDWASVGIEGGGDTMAHEIGHQLGLEHEPRGSRTISPFYYSLMSYSYGGIGKFSVGRFDQFRFDEHALNENLPFSNSELNFLSAHPYNLDVQAGPIAGTSMVDFNRNGVFGENPVVADITDGAALSPGDEFLFGKATGAIAIASDGESLALFSVESNSANHATYRGRDSSTWSPLNLIYETIRGREQLDRRRMTNTRITAPPAAVGFGDRIVLAFPNDNNINIRRYDIERTGRLREVGSIGLIWRHPSVGVNLFLGTDHTIQLESPYIIVHDKRSLEVWTARIQMGAQFRVREIVPVKLADGSTMRSGVTPSAVWDRRANSLLFLSTWDDPLTQQRLKVSEAIPAQGGWSIVGEKWLTDSPFSATAHRPVIAFDERGAGFGSILAFYSILDKNTPANQEPDRKLAAVKAIPGPQRFSAPGDTFPFRLKLLYTEWVESFNAPTLAPYRGDFAIAYRNLHPEPRKNDRILVHFNASGIRENGVADFNDVKFIAERGLRLKERLR